jgi:hypothetical protein
VRAPGQAIFGGRGPRDGRPLQMRRAPGARKQTSNKHQTNNVAAAVLDRERERYLITDLLIKRPVEEVQALRLA